MNFPPLTWFDLGASVGIFLAVVALAVGVVGYLSDLFRMRSRARVLAEAREMVGLIQKEQKKRADIPQTPETP